MADTAPAAKSATENSSASLQMSSCRRFSVQMTAFELTELSPGQVCVILAKKSQNAAAALGTVWYSRLPHLTDSSLYIGAVKIPQ